MPALQYTFVFMWTPAMEARTVVPPAKIPFGLIFASFMVWPLPTPRRARWRLTGAAPPRFR